MAGFVVPSLTTLRSRLPSAHEQRSSPVSVMITSSPPRSFILSRRSALLLAISMTGFECLRPLQAEGEEKFRADTARRNERSSLEAKVTDRVYFDMKVAGRPAGRIVIGLFGNDAPESVQVFKKLCSGELVGKGGRKVGYRGSSGWRVVRDKRVDLGRVMQIDEATQMSGVAQRVSRGVQVPRNTDRNELTHDVRGVISVAKGGGAFEFTVCPSEEGCRELDTENTVIGRVLEGMDVVSILNAVPTNRKTARDAFRNVGQLIGDSRAKVKLENKPLQKIVVYDSGIL